MGWKNQLTKTPYLVLFIILITVGVGTASALVTITLAGDVIITDDLKVDTDTLVVDSTNNRVGIGDISPGQTLEVDGNTKINGELWVTGPDAFGNDFIRFDNPSDGEAIFWFESADEFRISDDVSLTDDLSVGAFGSDDDDTIYFDSTGVEWLRWDDSQSLFEFSDDFQITRSLFVDNDIEVTGKLTVGDTIDPPAITFTAETHESIKKRATEVAEKEVVMIFWNTDLKQMEVYVISENQFYTFDGRLVE